jgi:hypothetical protein
MTEPWPPRHAEPAKTLHLHVRTVEGLLGEAIAITGSARALLKLRDQIDRALKDEDSYYPLDEGTYQDVNGIPFEVAVKRARSREEMREPVPKPERTAEKIPGAEKARGEAEEAAPGVTLLGHVDAPA